MNISELLKDAIDKMTLVLESKDAKIDKSTRRLLTVSLADLTEIETFYRL